MPASLQDTFGSIRRAFTVVLQATDEGEWDAIANKRPNSLWVHVSAIDQLDPLLRLYKGCASRTIGRPRKATVVKFHVQKPQITYLAFPNFDKEPHPALKTSMAIGLGDLYVRYRDYDPNNPPLLHQKDQTLASGHPGYAKFAKLSQQEQNWGLLEDVKAISDRRGWEKCLLEHGVELRGHQVVRRKEVD